MPVYRGPRPYTEVDELFFGRDREIDDIVDLIQRNRLSIVTAPSGVGKTSVLLAGVVPQLRQIYQDELKEVSVALGPTLVCRNWLGRSRRTADVILRDAIVSGIQDLMNTDRTTFLRTTALHTEIALKLRETAENLQANAERAPHVALIDFLGACAANTQRLTIIFDQFEDALRLPTDGGKQLLRVISAVFQQESRVRVLLSFRQEFLMKMHDLELSVGGLLKRTYYLQSVDAEAIDQIIVAPAQRENIEFTADAAQTLKGWLKQPVGSGDVDGSSDRADGDEAMFSLLALQALLVDVFEFLVEAKRRRTIDPDSLKAYRSERLADTTELAHRVLENHIEKVLARTRGDNTTLLSEALGDDESDFLLKRLFARMPPHLTSGARPGAPGYKNQVPLHKMIKEVLYDELRILGIDVTDKVVQHEIVRFTLEARNVSPAFGATGRSLDLDVCSGHARQMGWSSGRTAEVLIIALSELLRRLDAGNVLKSLGSGDESAYELVHDGLGPAVQNWADKFRGSPDDAASSLVKLSGVTFRWRREAFEPGRVLNNVFWQGCEISGVAFQDVVFTECDLRGTLFRDCIFSGGGFQGKSNLDGVIFEHCEFRGSKSNGNAPVVMSEGRIRSALFAACTFENLHIKGVRLDGTIFTRTSVPGKAIIEDSSLEVMVFRDCELKRSEGREFQTGILVRRCDVICSRIVSSNGCEQSFVYLDPSTNLYPPEPYFTSEPNRLYSTPSA